MQILAGIILLGVLITFHELGHFLFAKVLGVRVLVFSVGFGPKLIGFKRGETEYRLSAIPLGGYVRMFGESLEEELTPAEKKMSFMHQAIWRKSLIAFAGPLFNFILPIILFFFLLVGSEQVFLPRIGSLVLNGAADKAGLKTDDLITAVDGKPMVSFSEVAEIVAKSPNKELTFNVQRKDAQGQLSDISIKITPEGKLSPNPLEKNELVGRIGIMPAIELPVVVVSTWSPFLAAGLKTFDEIVEIDGKAIGSADELQASLEQIKPGTEIVVKRSVTGGQPETITITAPADLVAQAPNIAVKTPSDLAPEDLPDVQNKIGKTQAILIEDVLWLSKPLGLARASGAISKLTDGSLAQTIGLQLADRIVSVDGERLLSSVQLQQSIMHDPKAPHVIGAIKPDGTPMVLVFKVDEKNIHQMDLNTDLLSIFGIAMPEIFKAGQVIERKVSVVEAIKRATTQTIDIGWMTGKSLWLLVKREVPASQVGGPIMLFDVAGQAAEKGLAYYIFIMCLLSVNLGLLNLLPIPALDGGHLLLFGIEAVQRKPLTLRTRTIATQIGIAILLSIMALAIWNDLSRLFR